MSDLVDRLQAASLDDRLADGMLYREAADEIERLKAENARLQVDVAELAAIRRVLDGG